VTVSAEPLASVESTLPARSSATAWILLCFVVLAAGLIRVRLLNVPFERDEGEDAYAGQLILSGVPPYTQAAGDSPRFRPLDGRYLRDTATEQHRLTDATQALVMRRRDYAPRP
jgi:hypothetical protein